MTAETEYRASIQELIHDKANGLKFFEHTDNFRQGLETGMILNLLEIRYLQTNLLILSEVALDLHEQVHEGMRKGLHPMDLGFFWVTIHRYNIARFNLLMTKNEKPQAAGYFRKVVRFELDFEIPGDRQAMLFMIPVILKKPATSEVIEGLKDEEIFEITKQCMLRT